MLAPRMRELDGAPGAAQGLAERPQQRPAAQQCLVELAPGAPALGGDDDSGTASAERTAQNSFTVSEAVRVRRVEERHPGVEAAGHEVERTLGARPEQASTESGAAEPDLGDLQG